MALLIMVVIGVTLTSLILYTSANARNSRYAKANQVAYNLAEAGLNNALAIVENTANQQYLLQNNLLPAQMADTSCTATAPGCSFYDGGKVVWWGTLNFEKWLWTIKARGLVANPTGPGAAPVVRTLTVLVQITQPPSIPNTLNVWNTLYSGAPRTLVSPPAATACDVTFSNQGAVLAPVYVVGNLCLGNSADLEGPTYVGGWLYNMQPQTGIGTASPVSDAFVGNGCQYQNNGTFYNPCVNDGTKVGGVKAKTNVFANNLVTSGTPPAVFNGLVNPTVFWQLWYADASPGPWHPCWDATTSQYAPASQGPVPAFDKMNWIAADGQYEPDGQDLVLGGDAPGSPVNLTPATSYTCDAPGGGKLEWNATTSTLTVQGAIYIDGSAYINGPLTATYTGKGVIMLSGTLDMKNATLCAVPAAGNSCNIAAGKWDPNTGSMLIFATHICGTQVDVPCPDGIDVKNSNFQGGLYADGRITLDTTSQVQGPVVTPSTFSIGNKFGSSFPSVLIAPLGLPGTKPTYQAGPPTSFSG
jgi:hypothetical protein